MLLWPLAWNLLFVYPRGFLHHHAAMKVLRGPSPHVYLHTHTHTHSSPAVIGMILSFHYM